MLKQTNPHRKVRNRNCSSYLACRTYIYNLYSHFSLISPSCRVFSSMNLKISCTYSKPITSFATVLLAYVASVTQLNQRFCVNKSPRHLLISAQVLVWSYNRIALLITWKSSPDKVSVEPNLKNKILNNFPVTVSTKEKRLIEINRLKSTLRLSNKKNNYKKLKNNKN